MRPVFALAMSFLALVPAASFAGDWSFGLSGIPAFTIPHSGFDFPSPSGRFNYSIGFFGIRDLNPSAFLKASLQYTRRDVLTGKGVPDTRSAMDPATGRIDPSRIVYGDAIELFESVTMPVTLNFKFFERAPASLAISGGVEAGYLFYRRFTIEPTTVGKMEEGSSQHGIIVGAIVGITGLWHLSDRLSILMFPSYSYSWYPEADFGALQFHAVAVELGISMNL